MARFALAGLFALCLLAPPAVAEISDGVVKIGLLTDMSGPASDMSGSGSQLAAEMAVQDFGGSVAGRPIRIVAADHQLKPDIGAQIARRWYDAEQVDIILDVPVSAVALAVQEVARQKGRLFITHGSGTSDFTGKSCSPTGLMWVFNTSALAAGTAQAVVRRGGDRWFFLTADYAFGNALEREAAKVVVESGGSVAGSVKHPFNAPDLTSFIVQAQASGAKIIGLANGPPDNTHAIKAAAEFGLARRGQTLAGLLMFITDVHALGLPAAQGLLLTTSFYWDMDEQTRAWAQRFFEKARKMPTMVQAGVYSSVVHYLKAVQATGSDHATTVVAKMREMPVEDMFARHGKLREDGLMVHDLFLAQVKTPAESKAPWDYYKVLATIPGDEAFPKLADEPCPLLRKP
jgi:branched-chain amino acid transport system substrate-binding protein